MTFKTLRIAILLLILGYVGLDNYLSHNRTVSWDQPLRITVYPINADGSIKTDQYISQLTLEDLQGIETSLSQNATNYGMSLTSPVHFSMAPAMSSIPPLPPVGGGRFSVAWWSLKLRFWAWKEDNHDGIKPQIQAFALFYNPETHPRLSHSTGLEKGKIALINLYAHKLYTRQNNVILLHELLHTLGATDKYDLATGLPIYPDGYAEPDRSPLHPQKLAEIMGGRIMVSEGRAEIPTSLKRTVIGHKTAEEIGWR